MQLRLAEAVTRAPGRPARGYKSATSPERSRGLSPNKMQCSVLQQAALPVLPEPINTERHLAGQMVAGNTATFRQHNSERPRPRLSAPQAERGTRCLIRRPWRRQTTPTTSPHQLANSHSHQRNASTDKNDDTARHRNINSFHHPYPLLPTVHHTPPSPVKFDSKIVQTPGADSR